MNCQVKEINNRSLYIGYTLFKIIIRQMGCLSSIVGQQLVILDSFEKNANRLIAKYKIKTLQIQLTSQQSPQEQWMLEDWINWANINVHHSAHCHIRLELENMFKYGNTLSINYEEHQLTEDVMKEMDKYSIDSSRYNHSETIHMCIMHSAYTKLAAEKGIHGEKRDQTLWKIGQWKDKHTKTKSTSKVNNFKVNQKHQVSHPILACKEKDLNPSQKNLLFPTEPLNKNEKKAQLLDLDNLSNQVGRFWRNQISEAQFKLGLRTLTNYDLRFAAYILQAKIKYSQFIYKAPANDTDGVLPDFDDNEIVAMVGDWGSGFLDSFSLIDELVLKRKATVIIHLGDVYYAGFPQQFKAISDKIKQLRKAVPNLRYYTIPGNHDYNTNGGPFYDYLADCNEAEYAQQFGFFCLRNRSGTLQYIGLDTAHNQRALTAQFDPTYQGTYIQKEELQWAKKKIRNFKGQTILLTHHQLFSPYEKILGTFTKFGHQNQQFNNKLSQGLFDVVSKVSLWFWGHEHRLAGYIGNAYGVAAARLLGNGSFQVYEDNYYDVGYKDFNVQIPKFKPSRTDNKWYDLTGALLRFIDNKINVEYIDMACSYNLPSKVTRNFSEIITAAVAATVFADRPYKILESSSLSFAVYKDYVWLNYAPTDFVFQLVDNPSFTGPVPSRARIYIKSTNNQYVYLSSWDYIKVSRDIGEASVFELRSLAGKGTVQTGDLLQLYCDTKAVDIGRCFYVDYYTLAAGGTTEITPIKIYEIQQ